MHVQMTIKMRSDGDKCEGDDEEEEEHDDESSKDSHNDDDNDNENNEDLDGSGIMMIMRMKEGIVIIADGIHNDSVHECEFEVGSHSFEPGCHTKLCPSPFGS